MTTGPRTTCRQLAEFLMDYVNEELDPPVRERFEQHLHRCGNCLRYLESYTATIRLCKSAFKPTESEVPREIPEDLVAAILAAVKEKS